MLKRSTLVLSFLCWNFTALAERSHYREHDFSFAAEWAGLYSAKAVGGDLALNLKLDPSFTEESKEILKQAMQIFMERSLKSEIIACAYANTTTGLYRPPEEFKKELLGALSFRKLGHLVYPGYLYIVRIWGDALHLGLGYVGLFYKEDQPLPGYDDRHYFYIALNSDYLGYHGSFESASDPEYWAGVIAHEVLHNLGYRHSTGLAGSFIGEYEQCLVSDGKLGTKGFLNRDRGKHD